MRYSGIFGKEAKFCNSLNVLNCNSTFLRKLETLQLDAEVDLAALFAKVFKTECSVKLAQFGGSHQDGATTEINKTLLSGE